MNAERTISREAQQREVERNYKAFEQLGADFHQQNHGLYALMQSGKIIELFNTWEDAEKAGNLLYQAEPFSIQEVDNTPINMGAYAHAVL